jgi:hypothetical protein
MWTKLNSTVCLSAGGLLSLETIVGAEYYPKGSLRSDALLRGSGERHEADLLFVNVRKRPLRITGEDAGRDADVLEAAGVRVYRRVSL